MAQPSHAPLSSPVCVIGSRFMAPSQFDIIVDKKSNGSLVITDMNHQIMFKVKPCDTKFHNQRVLLDVHGNPIVLIREKIITDHQRWNVFRGDGKNKSDKIFTTQTSFMIQFKTSVRVFLTNKTSSNDVCDFIIKGDSSNRNCIISTGDASTAIAQMSNIQSSENAKAVEDKFMVTIYPNVDYAFVVTLIAIVDAMKMKRSANKDLVVGNVIAETALGVGGLVNVVAALLS